jgi:hypothetical protein
LEIEGVKDREGALKFESVFNLVSNREAIDEETLEGLRDVSEYSNSLIPKGKLQMEEEDVCACVWMPVASGFYVAALQVPFDPQCLELFLKQRCNMFGIWDEELCIGMTSEEQFWWY